MQVSAGSVRMELDSMTKGRRTIALEAATNRGVRETHPGILFVLRTPLGCLLIAMVAVLLYAAPQNITLFTQPIAEDGDYAANSILIEQAKSARLLVGNYSRVGFNHPGPALLYPQAAGEILFHDALGVVPTPYNAHVLAMVLLNALLFGIAAYILREQGIGMLAVLTFVALFLVFARSLISDNPQLFVSGFLASTWMPYLYLLPFLLFLVSAAAVATGSVKAFPAFVVAGGLLVHGHVSFVLFVLVMALGALLPLIASGDRRRSLAHRMSEQKSAMIWSALLLLAFVLPIILHTVISWPGELGKYVSYSGARPTTQLPDALSFIAFFWAPGFRVIGLTAAVLLCMMVLRPRGSSPSDGADRFGFSLFMQCVLASACLLVYAMKGIDDLTLRYTAIFYAAVPFLVLWFVIARLLAHTATSPIVQGVSTALLLGLALGLGMSPSSANTYRGSNEVAATTSYVLRDLPATTPVLIELGSDARWPAATGVLVGLSRAGREACFVDPAWGFLVTRSNVCGNQALATGELLLFRSDAGRSGTKSDAATRISPLVRTVATSTPLALGAHSGSLAERGVFLGNGWSRREPWGVWTDGPVAHLMVAVGQCSTRACRLSLNLTPFLPRADMTQQVEASIGARQVAIWKLSEAKPSVEAFAIPPELVPAHGLIDLELRISSPRSPSLLGLSKDNRRLGIGLVDLTLDLQGSVGSK